MTKYLFQVNYVGEGITGLLKEGGTKRRAEVDKLFKQKGGEIEAFYYAYGETDLYIIADFPDNSSVAAVVLTITATKMVTIKTTVLMTPEEIDKAGPEPLVYTLPGGQVPLQAG